MNKEYQKIETMWKRDMGGTKKLIPGMFRNDLVGYLKNCQWYATEKIDGTNIRVHWDGHKISFGGRTDNAQMPSRLNARLQELFLNVATEQLFEQKFGSTTVTLYGEGYGQKIQEGHNYLSKEVDFILFDINVGGVFLDFEDVLELGKAFGAKVVPLIQTSTLDEMVSFVQSRPKSIISENREYEMEGIVCKPCVEVQDKKGGRIIVKILTRDI